MLRRLDTADIASARVNSVGEYLTHPQLAATDSWLEVESPAGRIKALRPPARLLGVEPVMGGVPAVGQHSDAVLRELAFDPQTIANWRETGVI